MSGMTVMRLLVGASAALMVSACATTSSGEKKDTSTTATNDGSGGPVQISASAQAKFEDALKALEAQKKANAWDYPSLEKKFQAAVDADPNLAEATYNLGVLAERQGKTQEATDLYKAALARKPSLRQAAENLGVIAQNSGDTATAAKVYTDILSQYPDDASSRARLADLARRQGDHTKAIELSREALFREPQTLQAYKTMMLVYYEQKQFSLARLIALRASKVAEGDPEIPYTLGLMSLAEKDELSARASFKKAVSVRPDFLPAHYQLCRMAFAQEDYQGAEEHLRRILQSDGKNPEALLNLGVAYKGMGQFDKAMQTYDEAAKVNPDMPELLLNRGVIIAMKGDPEKAITLFKQYIARKGEAGLTVDHPVHKLLEQQEGVIAQREEEKRIAEEVAKMEAEAAAQQAAMEEEEKKQKEAEFQKQKADARGDAAAPEKKEEPKKEEPKPEPAKKAPPPAKKKSQASSDEPDDGL